MEPIYVSINAQATGNRLRSLLAQRGYTVRDIQDVMGFEHPQAVYKWLNGKCLPCPDNLLILSILFGISINDLLVSDGEIPRLWASLRRCFVLTPTPSDGHAFFP